CAKVGRACISNGCYDSSFDYW
nr:immunoglobulin heavy chain junction region [Macaca mulatta]